MKKGKPTKWNQWKPITFGSKPKDIIDYEEVRFRSRKISPYNKRNLAKKRDV